MAADKPFDVFLSHNSADKLAVETLARWLEGEVKLKPFLDKWHLVPGEPWQEGLEEALDGSCTCAVFIGPSGIGPWENEEMRSALADCVSKPGFRVVPVLLPGATLPEQGKLPRFLKRLTWVDFRTPEGLKDANALRRLVAGIRGVVPGRDDVLSITVPNITDGIQVEQEDGEEGLLDLLELTRGKLKTLFEIEFRMNTALKNFNESSQSGLDEKQAKNVSSRLAVIMEQFVTQIETDIPIVAETYSTTSKAFAHASMLWSEDFGRGDKQSVKETLATVQKVRSTLEDYRIDIISFRGKIAKIPRLTKGLNQAKRRMLSVLDKRSEHLEAAVNCLFGIEGMLKKFTEQGITIEL